MLATVDRGPARLLVLTRSDKKNALSRALIEALVAAVERAGDDPAVRGVVLAAEGDVFAAGGDLDELAALVDDPRGADGVLALGHALRAIERAPIPVLAALSGDAYGGGCELLLLCDYVIAEEQARLAFRHAKMGLAPAWGGTARLLERVGRQQAARLLFTADRVDARTAHALGLVGEVVATGQAQDAACAFVERVAANDRLVVATQKRLLVEHRAELEHRADRIERRVVRELWGRGANRAALLGHKQRRG